MAEQSDLFDEFSARTGSARNAVFYSISPALERAKVIRDAPIAATATDPAPPISEPVAVATSACSPVQPRVVTTRDEVVDMIRHRRDELGVTHETIDHITGWAGGYASKVLSPEPIRGLGPKALALVLEALALGIVRVEFIEDSELAEKMKPRWVQRLRPLMKPRRTRSALLADAFGRSVTGTDTGEDDMGQLDEQIVLRVDGDDRRELERLAEAQHRTMANYLRCLVKDHIAAARQQQVTAAA